MSAWICRFDGKADRKIGPPRSQIPSWKGPSADPKEKHEPVSDIPRHSRGQPEDA